jgi:hypothetical protein
VAIVLPPRLAVDAVLGAGALIALLLFVLTAVGQPNATPGDTSAASQPHTSASTPSARTSARTVPLQLRHAHAIELAHGGVPLNSQWDGRRVSGAQGLSRA